MQPANNMYRGGKPSERPWMRPSSKLQQRLVRFFVPGRNRPPQPGNARDLPRQLYQLVCAEPAGPA